MADHFHFAPFARPSRRDLLRLGAGAAAVAPLAAHAAADVAARLAGQIRQAAARGAPLRLPAGVLTLGALELPSGAWLIGARQGTTLKLVGEGPLFYSSGGLSLTLEGVGFDGAGGAVAPKRGLLDFANVPRLTIRGCAIRNSTAHGVNLRACGGVFAQNLVEHVGDAGYFSLDGLGLDIDGNHLRHCGDNGLALWTSNAGAHEGSRIRNNKIEDVRNISGGNGPYGNGVSIFRSADISVENNRISRCAYTAVRNNAGHDIVVIGNDCADCGEKAMYAEFGAKRAIFRNNKIKNAGGGIAVANAEDGTDHGVVEGNVISGLRPTHPDPDFGPDMFWLTGVLGERNCRISGNKILGGQTWIGVALAGMRENLRVEDNVIEGADYGVGVNINPGVGNALVAGNQILGSRKAAIAAMKGNAFFGPDLWRQESGDMSFPRLVIKDNRTV